MFRRWRSFDRDEGKGSAPTTEDTDPARAIDPQTILKIYVDLLNSERQAIWARNGAMLIGNSSSYPTGSVCRNRPSVGE
jgi:hypothetical protein